MTRINHIGTYRYYLKYFCLLYIYLFLIVRSLFIDYNVMEQKVIIYTVYSENTYIGIAPCTFYFLSYPLHLIPLFYNSQFYYFTYHQSVQITHTHIYNGWLCNCIICKKNLESDTVLISKGLKTIIEGNLTRKGGLEEIMSVTQSFDCKKVCRKMYTRPSTTT